jgi:hypothetical protein
MSRWREDVTCNSWLIYHNPGGLELPDDDYAMLDSLTENPQHNMQTNKSNKIHIFLTKKLTKYTTANSDKRNVLVTLK